MSQKATQSAEEQSSSSQGIYCYMDIVAKEAERYAAEHTSPMSDLLEEIEEFTLNHTPYPSMLTGRVEGRFLQLAVQMSSTHNIVEIGTFTGYSALAMAEVLPADGRIITIDNNPEHARIAREYFKRSPVGNKITQRRGEALEILQILPDGKTDLVFIDADKQNIGNYYRESMRILRDGGTILVDNALWYGRVFDPADDESKAMADFNEMVTADTRVENVFLTIRDGIFLIRKRTNTA